MRITLFFLLMGFISLSSSRAQNVNPGRPSEEINAQKHLTPEELRERLANVQLQKDASDLSDLCAPTAADLNGLKQGVLSKDLIYKLKRMEKLSKHLREQLSRASGS